MKGRSTCRMHGGTCSNAHSVVHGQRSKYPLVRLAARFEQALKDPELLSLRADIAVAEAFTAEALQKADGVDGCPACAAAYEVYQTIMVLAGKGKSVSDLMARLGEILAGGAAGQGAKTEVFVTQEHKRRLTETEIKRLAALGQFVTIRQAQVFIAAVLAAVNQEVPDQQAKARVRQRLLQLSNLPEMQEGQDAGQSGTGVQ